MSAEVSGTAEQEGFAWQVGIWDRMSGTYVREIDARFAPVVELVLARAALASGERVLDLGSGTRSVAVRASLSLMYVIDRAAVARAVSSYAGLDRWGDDDLISTPSRSPGDAVGLMF